MQITAALVKATPETVIWGNLNPAEAFCTVTTQELAAQTLELLEATRTYRNFVLSSGCEVPPNARLENLDAFHQTADRWNPDYEQGA
jgi:uroporphyrinogen decarboxylase